jgi:methylated-DNA-[protein]-cysteine S-methyltransferase
MITLGDISSPLGDLVAAFSEKGLVGLYFSNHSDRDAMKMLAGRYPEAKSGGATGPAKALAAQLKEYFTRRRREFDIRLDMRGTPFQMGVWRELLEIPYGSAATYGALARKLGSTARAVGGACGANPISIIVPCHRVLGAGGDLRGYAGGLEKKRFLLELEGVVQQRLIP